MKCPVCRKEDCCDCEIELLELAELDPSETMEGPLLPAGDTDHDEEDRLAYFSERLERPGD